MLQPQNQAMPQPQGPREFDEHVEPLFAGLSAAHPREGDPQLQDVESPPAPATDLWHDSRRAFAPVADSAPADVEEEPSTLRLLVKAIVLMLLLIAGGAFVYLAFGV